MHFSYNTKKLSEQLSMPPLIVQSTRNDSLQAQLQQKIDQKTKPLGALGELEPVALQLGLIQKSLTPTLLKPHVLVCAGDHGAAKVGISAYPQEVTWQMVENFLAGGAGINVFARQNQMTLAIADAGVAHDFAPEGHTRPGLINAKIAYGTANYLEMPAMSSDQAIAAMTNGAELACQFADQGCNAIAFGEMGIGNTASAALITHALTGAPLSTCVGRGTGLDDAGLMRKNTLLETAVRRADLPQDGTADPMTVLREFGGFEIAMLAGAMIGAAQRSCVLLIDGYIVGAAALVATRLAPALRDYCVFCHRSAEPGHSLQLSTLNASPLIDLGLRLGEGTGAALSYPLVVAACNFLNEMASFASAGVAEKS
jgi:nicotinate-nucleotide--dimethylbenzimidazole phosphoribosyltransferase